MAVWYRVEAGRARSKKPVTLRGLNTNHNHDLKDIFKGAAMRASTAAGPLGDFYEALLAKGRKPTMARLTLARNDGELDTSTATWASFRTSVSPSPVSVLTPAA
jgi:hypothetical protein